VSLLQTSTAITANTEELMLRKSELRKAGRRHDTRSTKTIEDAGWNVARVGPRYVASKRVIEDDVSITMRYE
jgi:hypothetical protein